LACRALAQILAPTLGPSGQDVLLPSGFQTNDGICFSSYFKDLIKM
jgi:chaperonin GroEL (HSP60 family)